MKSTLFKTSLLSSIFILFFVGFTHAAIGKIVALRGEAWVERDFKKIALKINSPILKKDSIHTGKRSRLQVMFNDETIASLGPESIMKVNDYEWDEKNGKFNTQAKQGIFHILGGKIVNTSPKNFKIDTPLASIGIRGSMFAFSVNQKELNVVFLGGKGIDVTSKFGNVALLKPGFGTKVSQQKKRIEKPRQFTPAEMKEFEGSSVSENDEKDKKENQKEKREKPNSQNLSGTKEKREEILSVKGQNQSINDIEKDINENILPEFPRVENNEDKKYSNNENLDISKSTNQVNYLGNRYNLDSFKITTDKNEFIINHTPTALIYNNNDYYFYSNTDFSGIETPPHTLASKGKDIFFGVGTQSFIVDAPSIQSKELSAGELIFAVNNENQRALGIFIPDTFIISPSYSLDGQPIMFFGTRDEHTGSIQNINFISYKHLPGDGVTQDHLDLKVSLNYFDAKFYGTDAQGFGLKADGIIKDINNITNMGSFSLLAAGFDTDGINFGLKTATSSSWKGFTAAFGKLTNQNEQDIFLSKTYDDFSLIFNRQSGTFTGNINIKGQMSSIDIQNLLVGGDQAKSAYIDDTFFMALLSAPGDSSNKGYLTTSTNQNFFNKESEKDFDYISWGYWSIDYSSNNQEQTSKDVSISPWQNLWVAGQATSQSYISQLNTGQVTLNYLGNVLSSKINNSGYISDVEGNFTLTADFNSYNISGTLSPDMKNTLTFNGNIQNTGLFNTTLNLKNTPTGSINGGFFGPNADTTAGNFNANINNNKFFGIFAGDKK